MKLKLTVTTKSLSGTTENIDEGKELDIYIGKILKGDPFVYDDFTEEQILGLQKPAQDAADKANNISDHPTIIGEDFYVYRWNYDTQAYIKTDIFVKGDAFSIHRVYASVAEMETDKANVAIGLFVVINTGSVEDEDTGQIYLRTDIGFEYIVDMSGMRGFTGKTPQISIGTVTTLISGSQATSTLIPDGFDAEGNPKFKLNFGIPKGEKLLFSDLTTEDITLLQKPALDAATSANNAATNANTAADKANEATNNLQGLVNNFQSKTGDVKDNIATFTEAATKENINTGESLSTLFGKIKKWFSSLGNLAFKNTITIAEVDTLQSNLDNKVNLSSLSNYIPLSQKGSNSGVAELDSSGKVLASQLPSYVDDVIDVFATFSRDSVTGIIYNIRLYLDSTHINEIIVGESGKIYIDISGTNIQFRWSGSQWSDISSTIALGETSATAYRGDRGKVAYDYSQRKRSKTDLDAALQTEINGKEPGFTKNAAFNKNFGTAAGTVCQGNDTRLSNARPANGGNANTVGGLSTGSFVRNDNADQLINGNLILSTQNFGSYMIFRRNMGDKGYVGCGASGNTDIHIVNYNAGSIRISNDGRNYSNEIEIANINQLPNIYVSATEPSSSKEGDIWVKP